MTLPCFVPSLRGHTPPAASNPVSIFWSLFELESALFPLILNPYSKRLRETRIPMLFLNTSASPSPQCITVGIYGGAMAGKSSLLTALNSRSYTRLQDRRRFIFDAQMGSVSTSTSMAIVVMDATQTTFSQEILPSFCIAITKTDHDYSEPHLAYLRLKPYLEYTYDIDCVSVNATVPEGLDELLAILVRLFAFPDTIAPFHRTPPQPFSSIFKRIWSSFLDWIAARLALPPPKKPPATADELLNIRTDSDVAHLMESAMSREWVEDLKHRLNVADRPCVPPVIRIPHALAVKNAPPPEPENMEFVRRNTTIPIPRIHHPHLSWLVMDFIEGEMLYECWDKLSRFMQIRIACTLRLYVKQLRSLTSQNVGMLGTGRVGGVLFEFEEYGPFCSLRRFKRFCELVAFTGWGYRMRFARSMGHPLPLHPRPTIDWRPVFTHGDLNASNILLDKQGSLWILDWGTAGFYPLCMESITMHFMDSILHSDDVSPSWRRYRHFIAGATTKDDEEFWYNFYSAIHRFPR
ncbi:hypothetical protein K474DRAFT_1693967 [Panus rudis PR-1116 ss-1]|nr:hypothetical protein K474DRAFT_1693967 [Panus rudis PR-1116 ss-1]